MIKSEVEIRLKIGKVESENNHALKQPMAKVAVDGFLSIKQLSAVKQLEMLYWSIGQEMPEYPCMVTFRGSRGGIVK